MYARRIYSMMMAGAVLLMMSCSAEDVVKETTSEGAIAISFSCNYDDEEEESMTRAGHQGVMNTEDLYATGFGVMASVSDTKVPDFMYNQEVKFTFVGDMADPLKGFWSYQPVKYWPTDLSHCYISAYAPYVDPTSLVGLPADATGIVGISPNSEEPYITYRRCEKPDKMVDLLWYYKNFAPSDKIPEATATKPAGTLNMKMRHALTRLEIKVVLAADEVIDLSTTKVLIEKITLTGKMAKTGRLSLCSQKTEGTGDDKKYYPVWTNQTYDKDEGGDDTDHTILIKNEDNDPEKSYGIIDAQVRYIPGMPYAWQPEGLKKYDGDIVEKDYNYLNALSTGDRKGYVYLIPQDGPLELTVKVKYHKMTAGYDDVKTKTTTATFIEVGTTVDETKKLYGNTTYTLYIKLSNLNSI